MKSKIKKERGPKAKKIYMERPEAMEKDTPIMTLNQWDYCPVCKKHLRHHYGTGENWKPLYSCDCAQNREIKEFVPPRSTYEIGITHSDKGVISMYWVGKEYYIPNHMIEKVHTNEAFSVFTKTALNRVSININTGEAYFYVDAVGTHLMRRLDWAEYYSPDTYFFGDDLIKRYIEYVLKVSNLPVTVETEKGKYNLYYIFKTKDSERNVGCATYAVKYLADLIKSPNTAIRYDEFTGKTELRAFFSSRAYAEQAYPHWTTTAYKKAQPRQLMDEGKYINLMCETFNIPKSAKAKKLYRENPLIMSTMACLSDMGINNPDNMYKFINNEWHNEPKYAGFRSFIRAMVRQFGETITVNKVIDSNDYRDNRFNFFHSLIDTISMWRKIKKVKLNLSFNGSLLEIHDRASAMMSKLNLENREIPYTKTELNRNMELNGYRIQAAKDTNTLVDIGSAMHICVGSYGDRAVSKQSTIYYVTDADGKYQACIELHNNKLLQAKGYCNQSLGGPVGEVVKEWLEVKNIAHLSCYDYKMLIRNQNLGPAQDLTLTA